MLYESVEQAIEANALVSQGSFHPLPTIDERDIWDNVDPEVRAYFDGLSAGLLQYAPSPLPASLYADFFLTGNRQRFEKEYFERRRMLLGCVMSVISIERLVPGRFRTGFDKQSPAARVLSVAILFLCLLAVAGRAVVLPVYFRF